MTEELKELLERAFTEGVEYEATLNSKCSFKNFIKRIEVEQLNLPVVSNRREMLIDFYTETCNKTITREYAENIVDDYISN